MSGMSESAIRRETLQTVILVFLTGRTWISVSVSGVHVEEFDVGLLYHLGREI